MTAEPCEEIIRLLQEGEEFSPEGPYTFPAGEKKCESAITATEQKET